MYEHDIIARKLKTLGFVLTITGAVMCFNSLPFLGLGFVVLGIMFTSPKRPKL